MACQKVLIAVTLLLISHAAWAFCPTLVPTSLNGAFCLVTTGGTSETHTSITREAILDLDQNEFFPQISPVREGMRQAIVEIAFANAEVDLHFYDYPTYHFDAEDFGHDPERNIDDLVMDVISALQMNDVSGARYSLGMALHGIQDFYSHSNYIENNQTGAYSALWDPSSSLPFVSVSTDTCKDCDVNVDGTPNCQNDNILISHPDITTNYFGAEPRPALTDKCRHGGPCVFGKGDCGAGPFGGINKDTRSNEFSPHHWLHGDAATSATDATKAFIRYIAGRIGNGQLNSTNSHLRQLLGVGPDLAIALDTTCNMGFVLPQVKSEISAVVDRRIGTDQEPVRYVLSPFGHDASGADYVGPLYVTDDAAAYKNAVNGLVYTNTGPCPVPSMSATLLGLSGADDGADLFLIAADVPSDSHKVGHVISVAQTKKIKVYPEIYDAGYTSTCPPARSDPAYDLIATATQGQVFSGHTQYDGGTLTSFVDRLTRTNGVNLLAVSDTTPQSYTIPVDSSITRLVFSLTDVNSSGSPLTLTRPNGTVVTFSDSDADYRYFNNGRLITITPVATGNWTAAVSNVTATRPFQLNVTGDSTFQLNRFTLVQDTSGLPHPGYFDIDGFPRTGQTIKGAAQLDGSFSTANFELRSRAGALLASLNFSPDVAGSNAFFGDVLIPPVPFLAYVKGSLSDGTQYQRVSDKAFEPQTVTITAPPGQVLEPGLTYNYRFTITNNGPQNTFHTWSADDKSPTWVSGGPYNQLTLGASQQATVTVPLNVPSDAPVGTLNNLSLSVATGGAFSFTGVKNFATVRTLVVPEPNGTFGLIACIGFLVLLQRRRKLYC